tara:strand:- start:1125 stop:2318 length:1194 start_codon:yes stop_codon:yes gene_type:complete
MKKILFVLFAVATVASVNSQEKEKGKFFKSIYNELFKYGTFYVAGNIDNPKEEPKDYFVRTNPDGNLYAPPVVVDGTDYYDYDYRYGFGIRKIARFDYERKAKDYYDGTESNVAMTAPNSSVLGLEYVFHTEKERSRDEIFKNHRYFLKHSGKYHMVKLESRAQGKVDFKYKSAEVRAKLPIGKKFSLSAGAMYRTHERPYGYNPVEIWLNETDENGWAVNPWYTLGFYYGYDDIYYTQEDQDGNETSDWYWVDEQGETVAYTDLQFRDTVFAELMNRYNHEVWDTIDAFGVVSPVVGFDFYHFKSNFWLHAYGSYLLPYHKYVKGDEDFSYLNRNNWGLGGLKEDSDLEQWEDFQAGINFGWKLNRSIGVFFEGEYTKFWDSRIYNGSVGLNITLR